jgi:nitroreductase
VNRREIITSTGALALVGAGAAYLGLRQMGSMSDYNASVAETRAVLSDHGVMRDLVRYATLAPNGHNTQPWRFRVRKDHIAILPDFSRRTPIVDPDDHHLFVSIGCAAENLAIAAGASGRPSSIPFQREKDGSIRLEFGLGRTARSVLFDAIPRRQSTRAEFDGRSVSASVLRTLVNVSAIAGIDIILITERLSIDRLSDLIILGNSAQMADTEFVRELKTWLRYSPREAIETGDGLFTATTGNPILPTWLGPSLLDLTFRAQTENEKYRRQLRSSAGVAVFVGEQSDPDHWVRAGRACQRFALQAMALGLKVAFINQPVEVASLRPALAQLVGTPGRRPDLVMRFGYGAMMPFSARRSVAAVLA